MEKLEALWGGASLRRGSWWMVVVLKGLAVNSKIGRGRLI